MIDETTALTLHDRATRGEALSVAEQQALTDWYAYQDELEAQMLPLTPERPTINLRQADIDALWAKITVMSHQIRDMTAENERLRQEIADLRHQLTEQLIQA